VSIHPRISSIENVIATDPGDRNVFGLVVADQLRLAAQSLRLGRRIGMVSGFFISEARAGETDGPPGAKALGLALRRLGIHVDYITDQANARLFRAIGIEPLLEPVDYLDSARPTHLLSIERVGRGSDGRYRNMRGFDISETTTPLDDLFIEAARRGISTIGIGDGGNEIGMGKVFADALATIEHGPLIASIVPTDFCIAAGISNWGAYGLVGALSVLEGRDLLPATHELLEDIERLVNIGGAVDGVTHLRESTVDGRGLSESARMIENIRRQITPSPFERREPLLVGVVGYGETGRGAAKLLTRCGHRVRISDQRGVTLDAGLVVEGVETGQHTIEFLGSCDCVVTSPGVRGDAPIVSALHHRGIPVMSELEMAFQLCDPELIAVSGTIGKRTTVEMIQRFFLDAGTNIPIGGNRGRPLSELVLDRDGYANPSAPARRDLRFAPTMGNRKSEFLPIAVAVSSFQLESVVSFRPHVAILLNIDEAHLDRHRSVAEYARTKSRIFMNHRPDDVLILNFDDPRIRPLARKHRGRTFFVSAKQEVDRGAWSYNGEVYCNIDGRTESLGVANHPFPEDLLSAVLATRLSGIASEALPMHLPMNSPAGARAAGFSENQ